MSQRYADIIIDISHEAIDKTFQYIIPDELDDVIEIGMQVKVPFGQGNRTRNGYVIGISDKPDYDVDKLKAILRIDDKGLMIEGKLIKLAAWMREKYGSTMINCLQTVMPVKEQIRKHTVKTSPEYVVDTPIVTALNDEQQRMVDCFINDQNVGERKNYLLHGVTGSGKTEVYIECIKSVIKQGRQAIVLVPEIALTYQNVARFKRHFGDKVAVINSKQSKGEKYREFTRAKKHEVDVVIGPRSALFTPCESLGLIIIDEEHDTAYKSDQTPRYHAKDVAIKRAELEGASVILGSATPSLESYMMAKLGRYELWELNERPDEKKLARVKVVDLRQELRLGNRSIISNDLSDAIYDRLSKKEQIMLFINRRGYNSFISCRECGEAIKCPKCDVSLSLHNNRSGGQQSPVMMCHYCGYTIKKPDVCPNCSSRLIGGFGTGTEKVEEEIKKLFPEAVTIRMDKDTTTRKDSYKNILEAFKNRQADILIGTQMIVKGHDFPNVTLVGIMVADTTLFENDYRAGEKTFDLLTQAAGRAGRGDREGLVIIQTYKPDNYAIATAANQDYKAFYELEMAYRRMLSYPPVCNMMVILMIGENKEILDNASNELGNILKDKTHNMKASRVIGPSDATIGKINLVYRRVIYIKSKDPGELVILREIAEDFEVCGVSLVTDINPVNMY